MDILVSMQNYKCRQFILGVLFYSIVLVGLFQYAFPSIALAISYLRILCYTDAPL